MQITLNNFKFNRFYIFFIFTFLLTGPIYSQVSESFKIKTVVLDPGHGGSDPGTVWGKYHEKDITLSVAKKLGNMIKSQYPDIKIVYTRDRDVFVPLFQRGKIANNAKGDLFVSIHVNGAKATSARGVETFTLGMHKSAESLEIAKKENSVIVFEQDYKQSYEGFDPNDDESYILFGLGQHAFGRKSITFSSEVQSQYKQNLKTLDRGMKQAGFLVLWATSMPCVLTEIGFLSNSLDREYLVSNTGQDKIAKSLFNAFSSYKKSVEIVNVFDVKTDMPEVQEQETPAEVYYSVQVMSSVKKIAINSANFKGFMNSVFEVKENKSYKYCVGKEISYKEILSLQEKLRKNGFKGAFVVAFERDQKISLEQAKEKLK